VSCGADDLTADGKALFENAVHGMIAL